MKKIITTATVALTASSLTAIETERVTFESQGQTVVGTLYLPDTYNGEDKLPAAIVTGAWTTVKEQMPATYATALARSGYAALTFDFRGWGESKDPTPFLENPSRKIEDIVAASDYLATRSEVDADRIGGLGICASSGYMVAAAIESSHLKSIALVAPWLHDAGIVRQVYGGEEGVAALIKQGQEAAQQDQPVLIEAASSTNESSLMYGAPYYTESDRGLIPAYDNQFNVASWEDWLTFDALKLASALNKPTLLVHSHDAAIPQGAEQFSQAMGGIARIQWVEGATQFDFYDQEEIVDTAMAEVLEHFGAYLNAPSDDQAMDAAAIRTVVESVATLADRGDFETLEALYADQVLVDYTSLTGGDVETKSAQALMTEWASVLPGFDRTRHQISEIEVQLNGTSAVATAKVVADHFVNDLYWQVSGRYRYELKKEGGDWRITAHTFLLESENGTRDVFGPAAENAAAQPASYIARQQTQQTVRNFLRYLETKDMPAFNALWAEDAVQEMPFSPNAFPATVRGKENLMSHYQSWPEISGTANFTDHLILHSMQDPNRVFAEWKGDVEMTSTGQQYQQTYAGLFHIEDGKITLFREYFNPIILSEAFGLDS